MRRMGTLGRALIAIGALATLTLGAQSASAQTLTWNTVWEGDLRVHTLANDPDIGAAFAGCPSGVGYSNAGKCGRNSDRVFGGYFTYNGAFFNTSRLTASDTEVTLQFDMYPSSSWFTANANFRLRVVNGKGTDASPSDATMVITGRRNTWTESLSRWRAGRTFRIKFEAAPTGNVAPAWSHAVANCAMRDHTPPDTEVCSAGEGGVARDPNGDTLTYSLTGRHASNFEIDSGTGAVKWADENRVPDYARLRGCDTEYTDGMHRKRCYRFDIVATDPGGRSASKGVYVWVMDTTNTGPHTIRLGGLTVTGDNTHVDVSWTEVAQASIEFSLGRRVRSDENPNPNPIVWGSTDGASRAEYNVLDSSHNVTNSTRFACATDLSDTQLGDRRSRHYFLRGRTWTGRDATAINGAWSEPVLVHEVCGLFRVERALTTAPLTAQWNATPATHNGTAFTLGLEFSEAVSATADEIRSAISATGATVTAAALAEGSDTLWNLTVTPSGTGNVSLLLSQTTDCSDTNAICTSSDNPLSNGLALALLFAPWLSVADAEATEGTDPTLDFTVTLAPAASETVTVDYATADGTATQPADYTATTGTLSFTAGETTKTVSVPIVDDTTPDNGETFTLTLSNPSGGDAVLADSEATGTILNSEAAGFSARFVDMPATHDGSTDIVFELRFSQDLISTFSYVTLRDDAFTITNGTVEAVERIVKTGTKRNRRWEITVDPTAAGENVVISLPARACTATGAVCNADNDPLKAGVSATVAPQPVEEETVEEEEAAPLTVAWTTGPPAEHDGSTAFTVAFSFSENLASGFSYTTIRDKLSVTQGGTSLTPYVKRKTAGAGNDRHWIGTVTPDGKGDISIGLSSSASCGTTGAICTSDDRALSNALPTRTVKGPPGLSVADAEATEGTNATMDFTVTLSRAASAQVTVDYATSDGTATAGSDYTTTSGTLTFSVGDTSKTVAVPILTDTVDDDGETFTLTLSNESGGNAWLADATATGTIRNSGGMPRAWITRFGRTIAGQAVDAVGGRMEGGGGNHVRVGGVALNPGAVAVVEDDGRQPLGLGDLVESPAERTQGMSGRELLLASSFNLSAGGETGGPAFGAWGRVETGSFEAEDDGLTLDGDVTTGFLGADMAWERWLAGLAISFSSGEGAFAAIEGEHAGTVESSLTSLYPYARMSLSDRVSAWGLLGLGSGELTLRHGQGDGERTEIVTDIGMRMGALGVRGEVLAPTEPGGLALAIKSDAFLVQTESDAVRSTSGHLMAAEGEASRVRLIAEASRAFDTGGGTVTPSVEIGVRHDGGDAETGSGIEAGASLRYAGEGFSVEASVRTLLAHESAGYEEFGASGAVRIDPGPSGEGLSLTLAPRWGAADSGAGRLWGLDDARALAPEGGFEAGRSLEAEIGYGLGLGRTAGMLTPYVGLSLADGSGQAWRTGARWDVWPGATLGLEARRNEAQAEAGAESALLLRGAMRW